MALPETPVTPVPSKEQWVRKKEGSVAPWVALRQRQGVPTLPKQKRRLSALVVFTWLSWLWASASNCQFLWAPLHLLFEQPLNARLCGPWGFQMRLHPRDLVISDSWIYSLTLKEFLPVYPSLPKGPSRKPSSLKTVLYWEKIDVSSRASPPSPLPPFYCKAVNRLSKSTDRLKNYFLINIWRSNLCLWSSWFQ